MSTMENRLVKLREERIAREKARIEKLRELNYKKYNKEEFNIIPSSSSTSTINKQLKDGQAAFKPCTNSIKNNVHVNRPISAPLKKTVSKNITDSKPNTLKNLKKQTNLTVSANNAKKSDVPVPQKKVTLADNKFDSKNDGRVAKNFILKNKIAPKNDPKQFRKSLFISHVSKPPVTSRKTLEPLQSAEINQRSFPRADQHRETVFDRLYKPKMVVKNQNDDVQKLHRDPNYLRKVIHKTGLILNKQHTVFDTKSKIELPVRRSISAVHFKRISKNELKNCIHKWSSIGEKLDKVHLSDINEDDMVQQDKVISAVKSERKRVKFQTPVPLNFNTPRPEEMQTRLKNWLQKRGKSLDSYHHLQCFGIHHLSREIKPLHLDTPRKFDDEDKENVAVESDSDNGSFTENMNEQKDDLCSDDKADFGSKWRQASYVSEMDFNESKDTTLTLGDVAPPYVDEILIGALNDLTDLLKEGFDWEQSARWLRAIRDRFPTAPQSAAYWECRAALEERRGDLPASVQCWEEAIAQGTEQSVVEANLDQLLDKFMQLKISPSGGKRSQIDPKLVDVKNVFKSTVIRFAVQQAELRQSAQADQPQYIMTPVRRSARLSAHWSGKPLCTSVRNAEQLGLGHVEFVPNDKLCESP